MDSACCIDCYCNFNSLILSCQTWNIPKKHTSQIFTACRSNLDTSWECFMCDNSELSCWNFNGDFIFALSFTIGHDLFFWNKYWFANRSQFDPKHCSLPQLVLHIYHGQLHKHISQVHSSAFPMCKDKMAHFHHVWRQNGFAPWKF